MIYQTELCNLKKNKDEARLLFDLAYNCCLIDGQKGKNPMINYNYFKYHGTKEEFQNAKKELKEFSKKYKEVVSKLEKQTKTVPDNIIRIVEYVFTTNSIWMVQMERKNVNSSNPQTLYNNNYYPHHPSIII